MKKGRTLKARPGRLTGPAKGGEGHAFLDDEPEGGDGSEQHADAEHDALVPAQGCRVPAIEPSPNGNLISILSLISASDRLPVSISATRP